MRKQTKLWQIFALREFLLKQVNPKFFNNPEVAALVTRLSLAAQDWITSDNFLKSIPLIQDNKPFGMLHGYTELRDKYNLEFGMYPFGGANPAIPYELSFGYLRDYSAGTISKKGELLNISKSALTRSEVLKTFHNHAENGIPTDGISKFKDIDILIMKAFQNRTNKCLNAILAKSK